MRAAIFFGLMLAGCDEAEPTQDAGLAPDIAPLAPLSDIYVPPPPAPDSGPPPADISACVGHIVNTLKSTATVLNCDDYNALERSDDESDYNRVEVVAACLQLSCVGQTLDGHNGIPAVRTCADLAELELVMTEAGQTATQGDCAEPSFKVRIIPLANFAGGEFCDQFFCTVGPDGTLISQIE